MTQKELESRQAALVAEYEKARHEEQLKLKELAQRREEALQIYRTIEAEIGNQRREVEANLSLLKSEYLSRKADLFQQFDNECED